MTNWLRALFDGRPWWMNAMMVFCAYMTFIYVPWDLFVKPVAQDEEVWFGIMFTGWAAKLLTPFHWAIYAAGMVGFRRMRPWMWPWASVYVGQIAIGMLVWSVLYESGAGAWIAGITAFAIQIAGGFFNETHAVCKELPEHLRRGKLQHTLANAGRYWLWFRRGIFRHGLVPSNRSSLRVAPL